MPNVSDFMTKNIVTVDAAATALEAAGVMTERRVGCLIVVEGSKPKGIVTERDFLRKITAQNRDASKIGVAEIMSHPLITVSPEAALRDAAKKMREHSIRRLAVTKDDELIGLITNRDITDSIMATVAERVSE